MPDVDSLLNARLDILKERLEVLNTQLANQHASKLEVIVIWLIVAEILITLVTFFIDRIYPTRKPQGT